MDALVDTAPAASVAALWLDALQQLLHAPCAYQWFPAAIRAGLLQTMTRFSLRFPVGLDKNFRYLLKKLLPHGIVYYHVVAAIAETLEELTEFCHREEFEALEIFDDWLRFLHIAERRVKLRRELDGAATLEAYDNAKCGDLKTRSQS
ncbi:hypothetical protein MSAN_01109700 [Mycena sanguinolenta]|uniref:Uncharacterized protein n=1 Tax=Mycena sanguinolenta TaxID=230812 RepID=A0A8H7D9G8_9AGAR|nr:hypothetical protein MSAN_01109700 [Mycena sanguinolenta]